MIALVLAAALAAAPQPTTLGPGQVSCREWLTGKSPAVDAWVLGYWSGMNSATEHREDVGRTLGEGGVLALVRSKCLDHLDRPVVDAAFGAYEVAGALGE